MKLNVKRKSKLNSQFANDSVGNNESHSTFSFHFQFQPIWFLAARVEFLFSAISILKWLQLHRTRRTISTHVIEAKEEKQQMRLQHSTLCVCYPWPWHMQWYVTIVEYEHMACSEFVIEWNGNHFYFLLHHHQHHLHSFSINTQAAAN